MNEFTKKLLNNFLIGVFAVIPIVVVLQIIIFVKGMVSELFPIYLVVDEKAALDNYLKSYLYGGRDSYAIMNSLYRQAMRLRTSTSPAPPQTADSDELTLPEWTRFLQLFRAILEHPNKMKDVPRFLRWIVFNRILYPESKLGIRDTIPRIDTLTMKLALQITEYFYKASGIDSKIGQQLDTQIGNAILAITTE